MTQIGRHNGFGGIGRGLVGEVAVPPEDALFEAPGPVRAILQHAHVVVRFEHEHVGLPDSIQDVFGDIPEVGDEPDVAAGRPEQESHRILRVVRNIKSLNGDITDFETSARFEETAIEPRLEGAFGFLLGCPVPIDGDAEFAGDSDEALDMVAMFVGDEDGVEIFGCSPDTGKSLTDLPGTEAGVDQDSGFRRLEIGAIAGGSASQDRELNSHGQP